MATISRLNNAIPSVKWRLVLIYVVVAAVALGAFAVSVISSVAADIKEQRETRGLFLCVRAAAPASELIASGDVSGAGDRLVAAVIEDGGRYIFTDTSGVILCDTADELVGQRSGSGEIAAVLSGSGEASGLYRTASGYTSCFAVSAEGGALLRVEDANASQTRIDRLIITVSAMAFIAETFVFIISYLLANAITRPVKQLTLAARSLSDGNFDARVEIEGRDELAVLGSAFNSIGRKLRDVDRERADFVSNASHELKTPLSSMKILAESLLYQENVPAQVYREFLSDIDAEIDRLNHIITDLLDISKLDDYRTSLKCETVNIGDLCRRTCELLTPLASQNGVSLSCVRSGDVYAICDGILIRQAITNIIDNAIKYTPPGGSISVRADVSGSYARVRVTDTGIGIPAEYLPHIFDRFYRVDKARSRDTGGTGLGLYITKKIVLMHGGYAEAESTEGRGSAFTLYIPTEASA